MAALQQNGKKKRKILDEEQYVQCLEKIIEKDFFPDVAKLQAQNRYLEAQETGDHERMSLSSRHGSSLNKSTSKPSTQYFTPPNFETPLCHLATPASSFNRKGPDFETKTDEENEENLPGLDNFLSNFTSEDNASFEGLMVLTEEKKKLGHVWLYEAETEFKERQMKNLALPSEERASLETWEYKAKNSLMYYPEGVQEIGAAFKKPREVVHKNSRFALEPFSSALNKSQIRQAAALNAQNKQGKVGPDGKELIPHESLTVNGYGFERTPSPAPGQAETPLITWGEIESTPFRLDRSETPRIERNHCPSFKIPEPGRRERLGLKMANEAAARNRAKKQEALRKASANIAGLTPKTQSTPVLTPALHRLVNRSNRYTDRELRQSYTPSPSHRTNGRKFPYNDQTNFLGTPSPRKVKTPSVNNLESITDNLLHLPKRLKASNFL